MTPEGGDHSTKERVDYDSNSDAFGIIGTENWRTWRIDLDARSGEPVDGIALNSGAIYVERIGDLSYALGPYRRLQEQHRLRDRRLRSA